LARRQKVSQRARGQMRAHVEQSGRSNNTPLRRTAEVPPEASLSAQKLLRPFACLTNQAKRRVPAGAAGRPPDTRPLEREVRPRRGDWPNLNGRDRQRMQKKAW